MALSDILGIDSSAGSGYMQDAINALKAVNVPNLAQLTMPQLKQFVASGVLTPQQYSAIEANPDVYQQTVQATQDNSGANAQKSALQQLSGISQNGGSTPINQANLQNNIQQTNQAMQAARGGIQENAQQMGVAGGGQELASQLMNEQSNAQNANMGAVNAGANNAQLALNAIAQQGQVGGTMQGQANQMSQSQAQAAQQIAQYNSGLQSAANQYNTQNANQAQAANLANAQGISNQNVGNANAVTQYNAQLPSQQFQMNMQKAGGVANQYNQAGQLAQNQAANQASLTGGLLGTGAQLGAAYMTGGASLAAPAVKGALTSTGGTTGYAQGGEVSGPCYAQGGEVHEHALCMMAGGGVPGDPQVAGDDPQNDTVDAKLSPHEIVLPNSVTQSPDPAGQAAQFVGQIKGQQPQPPMPMQNAPTVNSFAEVLQKLEENGLELRLGVKGA